MYNGELSSNFQPTKSIRKGDPISPYVFIICAHVLSAMLYLAQMQNHLQGVKVNQHAPSISHLLYVDDLMIFFFKVSFASCNKLSQMLINFSKLSGNQINRNKSFIWFSDNTPRHIQEKIAKLLRVKLVDKIGKYLGWK